MRRILLVCAAGFAVYFLANLPALYERVKIDRSFPALSRYEFEPTPEIALVGSSMTFRIFEQYFRTPVRNLAIGGGSPLTGLEIIASYKTVPRLVLVETNIMTRPTDQALVKLFGKNDAEPFKWFRLFRAAISAVYYRIKLRPAEPFPEAIENDISESLKIAMNEYQSTQFDQQIVRNVAELKRITADLKARGCKVVFFELPYPPPLGETYLAKKVRDLFSGQLRFSPDQLRFVDAFHMDERSAEGVARQIEVQLQSLI